MSQLKPLDWKGKIREGQTATVIGSAPVIAANPQRIYGSFVNDSANWMSKSENAAVGQGIPLAPNGGAYEINFTNDYFGPFSVACGAAAMNLAWTEGE